MNYDSNLLLKLELENLALIKKVVSNGLFNKILQLVPRLQRIYRRVEDVDLFIGAISEKPVPGAVLGPTFQCIVGDQFRRLRLGDRFWYEESNQQGSFNLGTL